MLHTLLDACFEILDGLCQRLLLPGEALVLLLCLLELGALQDQCKTVFSAANCACESFHPAPLCGHAACMGLQAFPVQALLLVDEGVLATKPSKAL